MAKVSAKVGLTLKLFKESSYEFIRPEVSIEGIDTDGDIQQQITDSLNALKLVWDATTEQMNKIIAEEMPRANAQLEVQVARKMKSFESVITELGKRIEKLEK